MKQMTNRTIVLHVLAVCALLVCNVAVCGQGTQFTYQGKLDDNGNPAAGQYDLQFKLFDTETLGTGTQLGTTLTLSAVQVSAGIFTVKLDFGSCNACFSGGSRYIEIAVKQTSGLTFTTLGPRQQLTSTPYAIRSLNAGVADGLSVSCTNCVTSSQIQTVLGSQVTGAIAGGQISGLISVASVPAGSPNYIQNSTSQQPTSNFNISGNGTAAGSLTANVIVAATQYNIGGSKVLANPGSFNLFAGVNSGSLNTASNNAFFGFASGQSNSTGQSNAFFGSSAGADNTTGGFNSFFGQGAGQHSTGHDNAFFGASAGFSNTADFNAFFGSSAGQNVTSGTHNVFMGYRAGFSNATATDNAFFGYQAGLNNTGGLNSFFGSGAGQGNSLGFKNSFFGNSAGHVNTSGVSNSFFGNFAGGANTTGEFNAFFGESAGASNTVGSRNTFIGVDTGFNADNPSGDDDTILGAGARVNNGVSNSTAIGSGALATASNTVVLGTDQEVVIVPGKLEIDTLGTAGSTNLCLNNANRVAMCSSSLRYKTDVHPFSEGLSIISRLNPVTFVWKSGSATDVGLIAEDVARIEPLLTFKNHRGEVEGVKYSQLSVAFINALKQQQKQIDDQQQRIEETKQTSSAQHIQLELYQKELVDLRAQISNEQDQLDRLRRLIRNKLKSRSRKPKRGMR